MKRLVMIVDDHAAIRTTVRAALEAEHLEVAEATNGAHGVQKAQEIKPSLVILDLSMPEMNGFEAAMRLQILMPNVPLLMFTNYPGEMVEKEARSAGICGIVSKSNHDSLKQLVTSVKMLLAVDNGIQCAS